jgi:cytochrome c-type biogenesis protein CcmE
MDPSRKRAIRLTVALTAAVLLASALIWESFASGAEELTASQLLRQARPGQTYVLAGTVLPGYQRNGSSLVFRVRDPKLHVAATVHYTGIIPDPFAAGRGVLVTVQKERGQFIGQSNSLTTKCPSKYEAAAGSSY